LKAPTWTKYAPRGVDALGAGALDTRGGSFPNALVPASDLFAVAGPSIPGLSENGGAGATGGCSVTGFSAAGGFSIAGGGAGMLDGGAIAAGGGGSLSGFAAIVGVGGD
jgi:hypothetical protein